MDRETLNTELNAFLRSEEAGRLCQSYRTIPKGAWGELYIRLVERSTSEVIKWPSAWVRKNALGYLRNYLRREHRFLP